MPSRERRAEMSPEKLKEDRERNAKYKREKWNSLPIEEKREYYEKRRAAWLANPERLEKERAKWRRRKAVQRSRDPEGARKAARRNYRRKRIKILEQILAARRARVPTIGLFNLLRKFKTGEIGAHAFTEQFNEAIKRCYELTDRPKKVDGGISDLPLGGRPRYLQAGGLDHKASKNKSRRAKSGSKPSAKE